MTTTTTSQATQVYQIFIKATPERIWEAITTPEFTRQFFHGAEHTVSEARIVTHGPDGDLWGDEEVFDYDPPRRLSHGWRSLYDPDLASEPQSRVTWEITDSDTEGVSMLTVTHDRLDGSPKTATHVSGPGWMHVVSSLKSLLETGSAL
ncbi:MAG TPA: SRPBCC domain-containing protein [Terrimesophilobacter sp.]|nr:SRPBCC domain-containing protein [Terrimesophilobacter sp.]